MNQTNPCAVRFSHRFRPLTRALMFAAVTTAMSVASSAASAAMPQLSAADQQEIQAFTLNDDFLHRYEAVTTEMKQHPRTPAENKATIASMHSLDAMTANIENTPTEAAALQHAGLKPRDAAVGSIVLLRVEMTDAMLHNPQLAQYADKSKQPSAANMAFYQAHKAEIQQLVTGHAQ